MRYCPNCGNSVPDGAAFCSNCGAPTAAPQQQERTVFCRNCGRPMPASFWACPSCGTPTGSGQGQPIGNQPPQDTRGKKKRTGMIVGISAGAIVLIALIVLAVIFLPRLLSSFREPGFLDYQTDLISARFLDPLSEIADGHDYSRLETDLTVTASTNDSEISRFLNGSSVSMKVDADKDGILLNGGLTLLGSNILNASLTLEDGKIGIYLPELDSAYYVADIDTLFQDLYYGSGTSISPTDVLNSLASSDISAEDLKEVLDPYLDELSAMLSEDKISVQKDVTVSLEGLSSSAVCTVYTYTPTYQDIQTLLTDLADLLENDQQLRALADKCVKALGPAASMVTGGEDLPSALDRYLRDMASQLRSSAPDLAQQVTSLNLTWTLAVENGTVRRICLAGSTGNRQDGLVYESTGSESKGMNEAYYIYRSMLNTGYGAGTQIQDCIRHDFTKSGGRITGTINYSAPWNGTLLNLRYDTDTGKVSPLGVPYGSYSLYFPYDEATITLDAKKGDDGVEHTFSYVESGDSLTISVNATEKTGAKKPDASPVDISNYSEDQIESIIMRMSNSFENVLLPSLMSASGGNW